MNFFYGKNKIIILALICIFCSVWYLSYNAAIGIKDRQESIELYENIENSLGFSEELYEEKFNSEKSSEHNSKDIRKYVELGGKKVYIYSNDEVKEFNKKTEEEIFEFNEEEYYDDSVININMATVEELMEVDGIDEGLAKKIVALRKEKGAFLFVETIKEVDGLSDEVYGKIKDRITVSKISKTKKGEK